MLLKRLSTLVNGEMRFNGLISAAPDSETLTLIL